MLLYCSIQMVASTGHSSDAGLQVLPDSSKLTMLIDTCYKSQQATSESQLKVVHLMSACAVADPGLYSMLLSDLEQITWQGKDPGHQRAAAAGTPQQRMITCSKCRGQCDLWTVSKPI